MAKTHVIGSGATGEGVEGEPEATLGGHQGSPHSWCRFCGTQENISADAVDYCCFKCRWASIEVDTDAISKMLELVGNSMDEAAKSMAISLQPVTQAIITMTDIQTAINSMGLVSPAAEISGASYSRRSPGQATQSADSNPPLP